jgi:hypothetical protein
VGIQCTPTRNGIRSDGSEGEGEEAAYRFIWEWGRVVDKTVDWISLR